MFSIIIPTYNRRTLLERAVNSVLEQVYTDWELLIIDDGSNDSTKKYISSIKDKRIKYFYQENRGESSARNVGIINSAGSYVCFLDSDDRLLRNYLYQFNSNISATTNVLCCGVSMKWGDKDKEVLITPEKNNKSFLKQVLTGHFNLLPFCFERSIVDLFDEEVELGEDFMFLINIVSQHSVLKLEEIQCAVYEHKGRFTRSKYKIPRTSEFKKSTLEIIEENRDRLENTFSSEEIRTIIRNKLEQYILGISNHSLSNALEIFKENKEQYDLNFMYLKLLLTRSKSIVKRILKIH